MSSKLILNNIFSVSGTLHTMGSVACDSHDTGNSSVGVNFTVVCLVIYLF